MPISTPFTAGIDMMAAPMRPSSFRSHETCEPSPTGSPSHDDLADAAERVAGALGGVDALDHRRLGRGVERAKLRGVGGFVELGGHGIGARGVDAAQVNEMAADGDAELVEQAARDRAGGDAGGRLAGRGALEDVARVLAVVLEDAREVGVARAGRA